MSQTHRAVLLRVHVLLLLLLLEPAVQLSVVGGLTSVVLLFPCMWRHGWGKSRRREGGRGVTRESANKKRDGHEGTGGRACFLFFFSLLFSFLLRTPPIGLKHDKVGR